LVTPINQVLANHLSLVIHRNLLNHLNQGIQHLVLATLHKLVTPAHQHIQQQDQAIHLNLFILPNPAILVIQINQNTQHQDLATHLNLVVLRKPTNLVTLINQAIHHLDLTTHLNLVILRNLVIHLNQGIQLLDLAIHLNLIPLINQGMQIHLKQVTRINHAVTRNRDSLLAFLETRV